MGSYFCKPFLAGALAAAGRAYAHGSEAVARASKVASDMYKRHGAGILEKAGMAKDFVSGYGMPLSAPTNIPMTMGTVASRFDDEINAILREGGRTIQQGWNEMLHPRKSNGEFVKK